MKCVSCISNSTYSHSAQVRSIGNLPALAPFLRGRNRPIKPLCEGEILRGFTGPQRWAWALCRALSPGSVTKCCSPLPSEFRSYSPHWTDEKAGSEQLTDLKAMQTTEFLAPRISHLLQGLHQLWPLGAVKLANAYSLKVCPLGPR